MRWSSSVDHNNLRSCCERTVASEVRPDLARLGPERARLAVARGAGSSPMRGKETEMTVRELIAELTRMDQDAEVRVVVDEGMSDVSKTERVEFAQPGAPGFVKIYIGDEHAR